MDVSGVMPADVSGPVQEAALQSVESAEAERFPEGDADAVNEISSFRQSVAKILSR